MTNLIIIIALTIFGEAAGEPLIGKQAVASVIWHRAKGDPATMARVCRKPRQFSCWNSGTPIVPSDVPSKQAWEDCLEIANSMLGGGFTPTIDATHYHNSTVTPYWAAKLRYVGFVGKHKFYKEE